MNLWISPVHVVLHSATLHHLFQCGFETSATEKVNKEINTAIQSRKEGDKLYIEVIPVAAERSDSQDGLHDASDGFPWLTEEVDQDNDDQAGGDVLLFLWLLHFGHHSPHPGGFPKRPDQLCRHEGQRTQWNDVHHQIEQNRLINYLINVALTQAGIDLNQ